MKIYLAGPYSHPDPAVREERYRALSRMAAMITNMGDIVYSPISHTHSFLMCAPDIELPTDWGFWKEADTAFLSWADEIWVLLLDGWKESVGVKAELYLAKELHKSIRLVHPEVVEKGDLFCIMHVGLPSPDALYEAAPCA